MKITAITVCVNYSDFFVHAVEANRNFFDNWIVVTDTKDAATVQLCKDYNLICVQTDVFYEGGTFKKFNGINEGLKHDPNNDWVLFIDADILLSPYTRRILEELKLNPDNLYGIDRVNCKGYDEFEKYLKDPKILINNWLLTNAGMEFGARIVHIYGEWGDNGKFTGYKPLGFFQLAHRSKFTSYPEGFTDASHGDVVFAKQWDRSNRVLIPEIMGVHLVTDNDWGKNWSGRKSREFKPKSTIIKKLGF